MPNTSSPFSLIVGLGNPGDEYKFTRHNIGFLALDALAEQYRASPWKKKFKALMTSANDLLLQKPQTYMNLSGEAVGEAMRFHKLAPESILVFHDDLDLPPGTVKVKQGGGSGGHNGLKSIDAHIGNNYWRARLGIGHPAPGLKGEIVTNHVLGHFAKSDAEWLGTLLDALAGEFGTMLDGKPNEYQSRVTRKMSAATRPEKP